MNAKRKLTLLSQKKKIFGFALLVLLLTQSALSQVPSGIHSAGGLFDTLFDRTGQKYSLADLNIYSGKAIGRGNAVTAVPSQTCQAGYFTLYYAPGSIFTNSLAAQTVLCKVFADISTLINSNCPAGAIKIYCSDTPTGSTAKGVALPFMSHPFGPINPNQGIIDNQVYKYLITGQDPYATIPLIFSSNSFYYHGAMQMDPGAVWNFNLGTTAIAGNEFDAYSIMLHEVIHSLGFYSLITGNGVSYFGSSHNFYSRYDQFLYDAAGNKLIPSSTPTSCPCNNLTFAPSTTAIAATNTGCVGDVTSCGSAVQYSSTSVLTKVYTPNCFEPTSSLSHFEDMCPFSATTDLGCATNLTPALNNNLYYVMSNGIGTGSCNVKRHPKEEERNVLCDLGYSVNAVYNSTVAGAGYTYTGGACNGPNVWGINDGIVNGVYTYTTVVSQFFNLPISINLSTIISNDSPNTNTVSCLELVTGNVTWTVSGGVLTMTANTGFSGLVIFRYMPQSTGSASLITSFGGPVYIFAYFIPGNCPPSSCDLVTNGGFESTTGSNTLLDCTGSDVVDCWAAHTQTPDIYKRICPGVIAGTFPGDSHNGTPNDVFVGIQSGNFVEERIMNNLSSPLVPGQVYQLSMTVYQVSDGNPMFKPPLIVWVGSCAQYISGSSYTTLATFSVLPVNTWTTCTTTFTFSGAINHNAIVIGGDFQAAKAIGASPWGYFYFDDISILPVGSPTFSIPNSNLCGNTTYTDLAQYASAIPGTFSGSFVTSYTTGTGTVYDFNASGTAPPGIYSIAFNYTAASCPKTIWHNVIVAPQQTLSASGSSIICYPGAPVSVTSSLNCSGCTFPIVYKWAPGNLFGASQTVTPASSTLYTVSAFNGTCTATQTLAVYLSMPQLTIAASQPTVCSGNSISLTATGVFTSAVWFPGTLSNPAVVNPTVNTTYSAVATDTAGCTVTQSVSIVVFTTCCFSTIYPTFTATSVSSTGMAGPLRILNSFTIQPNQKLDLTGSEFLFDTGVKLTVASGATLDITDSHLYACGANMWQGIEVLDGGYVESIRENIDNLIEDAIVGIDIKSKTTSSAALLAANTTFNKNHTDINIEAYNGAVGFYPYRVYSCVFTCRDLPYTPTAWPQTGESSSATNTSADLRYVNAGTTPTTGLASPYLNQSFSVTTLKQPYTTQQSHIAIKLTNVGLTNTTNMYGVTIGDNAQVTSFNLFDAHGQFISAVNSNVISLNNVFQNTQTYTTVAGNFGGAAISHSAGSTMNTELIMTGSNKSLGSRFWNCHKGVEGRNIYKLDVQKAIFRSTQVTTTPAYTSKGIEINTNRFDYYIAENEFTNQHTGINIPLAPGQFTPTGTSFSTTTGGLYADKLRITENAFTGSVSALANSYMEWAVNVSGPFLNAWNVIPNGTVTPAVHALAMTINTVTNARNGLAANGIRTLPTINSDNVVTLLEGSGAPQYGMVLVNANPTNIGNVFWSKPGENAITNNTVNFASTPANTSLPGALVYCDYIGYAAQSPSVTCNDLSKGVGGFLFSGPSPGTIWAGNKMNTLERGLVLSNNGIIGVQGGSMTAISNVWEGSWTSKSHTYVSDIFTDAINSKLYCKNTASLIPINNNGPFAVQNYSPSTSYTTTAPGAGEYNCYNMPNYKTISLPNNDNEFLSPEMFYMQEMAFYNLVHINDSIRFSEGEFEEFHDAKAEGSIGKFVAADEFLYAGDYSEALSALSEVGVDLNNVELNYLQFYTLYASYLENGSLSEMEAGELNDLAWLCPGTNGSAVFQARALYNALYHEIISTACDEDFGDRKALIEGANGIANVRWNLKLFPNPTEKTLNIRSNVENELLKVKILDLSGRQVYEQDVKLNGFLTKLELNLVNGAYFVHVQNHENRSVVQKLIIAK